MQIANEGVVGASLGVFETKTYTYTVSTAGYYQAWLTVGNALDGSVNYYVYVGNTLVAQGTVSVYGNNVEYKLINIGGLNSGDVVTFKLQFSGSWYGYFILNLGYLLPDEFASVASALNVPALSGLTTTGILISPPSQTINLYYMPYTTEQLEVLCLSPNITLTKSIPLYGQLKPGINYVTITVNGPLSSEVLNALNNALPNGATFNGVTVVNKAISGNTITITLNVAQTQGPGVIYLAIAIAILIIAVAVAVSVVQVSITQPKTIATGIGAGLGVGIAVAIAGVGLAIAYGVYKATKSR